MKGEFFFKRGEIVGEKWRKNFFFFSENRNDLLKNENDPLIFIM